MLWSRLDCISLLVWSALWCLRSTVINLHCSTWRLVIRPANHSNSDKLIDYCFYTPSCAESSAVLKICHSLHLKVHAMPQQACSRRAQPKDFRWCTIRMIKASECFLRKWGGHRWERECRLLLFSVSKMIILLTWLLLSEPAYCNCHVAIWDWIWFWLSGQESHNPEGGPSKSEHLEMAACSFQSAVGWNILSHYQCFLFWTGYTWLVVLLSTKCLWIAEPHLFAIYFLQFVPVSKKASVSSRWQHLPTVRWLAMWPHTHGNKARSTSESNRSADRTVHIASRHKSSGLGGPFAEVHLQPRQLYNSKSVVPSDHWRLHDAARALQALHYLIVYLVSCLLQALLVHLLCLKRVLRYPTCNVALECLVCPWLHSDLQAAHILANQQLIYYSSVMHIYTDFSLRIRLACW